MNAVGEIMPPNAATRPALLPRRAAACVSAGRLVPILAALLILSACGQPIGVTRVTPVDSYRDATRNVLADDGLSHAAAAVLQRHNLLASYQDSPRAAIAALQRVALRDGRRDILFALAEMNYDWGGQLPEVADPGMAQPPARDAYLQAAVYAYLYLLGKSDQPPPSPYDARFREACELYNRSLDLAFRAAGSDSLALAPQQRRLPLGPLPIRLEAAQLNWKRGDFAAFHPADAYEVYGFTLHNRTPGLGLPIIGVTRNSTAAPNGGAIPLTAFLRIDGGLRELAAGRAQATIELYSSYDDHQVVVNGQAIPLQSDTTAPLAYRLNDPTLWHAGLWRFITGDEVDSNLLFIQPYQPGRIPVVLVHGTGSSPVWWAEMVNTLKNDPLIRKCYQFWFYEYTSNKPVATSGAGLRDALTGMVARLDPARRDPALRQMVVIGHSQGGLLTRFTAVDPGNRLWRAISDQPFESLDIDPVLKAGLRRALFFEHLPFVRRVVFISTPHRGSFLTKDWVRELARQALTLPISLVTDGAEKFREFTRQLKLPESLRDKMPTSVDGMSADNPVTQAMARLPLAPGITGHSIIPVLPGMDIKTGNDGVVEYRSAHLDGMASEFIVRTGHSAQGHPLAIEEVRRILLLHLQQGDPAAAR